ncbi:MAG: hypothetical protein IJO64_03280 [Clostridia bacterium]|nr:hypothetical protein [Clostridia bacterium]MBQ9848064.1 hypothetical protein [Clostridia bacterium]
MAEQAVKTAKPVKKPTKKPIKKKRESGMFTQALAYFIVFLAFYIVITLFVGGLIIYSFNDTAKNTEIYSIGIVYGEKTLHKIDAQDANNEYGLYIPFSYLTEIGSFGIAGSGDDVTLFIIGTDNRIECKKNSSLIVINDNPIRISAPILYQNDEYMIPVVLLENYINGIDVTYDDEKMVCSVASDIGKTNVALKLLLPDEMEKSYFPDSYKYYTDVSDTSGN